MDIVQWMTNISTKGRKTQGNGHTPALSSCLNYKTQRLLEQQQKTPHDSWRLQRPGLKLQACPYLPSGYGPAEGTSSYEGAHEVTHKTIYSPSSSHRSLPPIQQMTNHHGDKDLTVSLQANASKAQTSDQQPFSNYFSFTLHTKVGGNCLPV